jgi:hypothetical protein
MAATAPACPCVALRSLAGWLTRTADHLERPTARVLALEPAPLAPSIDERLAELRGRYY